MGDDDDDDDDDDGDDRALLQSEGVWPVAAAYTPWASTRAGLQPHLHSTLWAVAPRHSMPDPKGGARPTPVDLPPGAADLHALPGPIPCLLKTLGLGPKESSEEAGMGLAWYLAPAALPLWAAALFPSRGSGSCCPRVQGLSPLVPSGSAALELH